MTFLHCSLRQRWLCAASPKAFAGFQLLKSSKNTFNNCNGDSRSEGAIVAIQDVQQHMYHFVIEPVGKKYQLVRYHSSWRSKRPCMSFISLYAESNKGEPLCINFNPGSCFVGISGRDEMKLYERAQNGFNLVNLKNDCAVAFVDGIPEFVKKPGNQFKIKLFSTFVLSKDIAVNVSELDDTFDKYPKGETSSRGRERTEFQSVHQHINILLTKLRMLSSFSAVLHYFDSGMNIWREVLAPVEFSLFYRSRFAQPESLVGHHGVPVHFFLLISQVDILLSEISLDVLLYFVGKLDLAGPYVVRQAVIFPNCCKFQENQNVVLSQGQSSAAYLRHIALESQLPDNQNIIKIFSWIAKGFSTSPISIISSGCFFFAWRTRLASLEGMKGSPSSYMVEMMDSRIFPGPIVVIEVAKKNEHIHHGVVFRRPEESSKESASVMLKHGDTVDDSKAMFEALDFDGGSRRTLMSLTLGNFLLSLRPQFPEYENNERNVSFSWSEEIKGEKKAQRVSGMFDKLNYKFRKALGAGSLKSFYSILCCPITMEGQHASDMHFLIQTIGREVPLMQPQNLGDLKGFKTSPVAMQVQKEIFIYPTIQVHNLLQCEIFVSLVENDPETCSIEEPANIGRQADIPSQSSSFFYANPDNLFFRVTLKEYGYTCKPVNSDAWVKKLDRKRNDAHFIDIELNFRGRAYFAFLRLSCSDRGFLEATIFTTYALHNISELPLLCYDSSQKFHTRLQPEGSTSDTELDLGCLLSPKSIKSWFFRGKKVHIRCLGEKTAVALLDLDILTGFTEISLEAPNGSGTNKVARLGVSLEPCIYKIYVPTQLVSFVPRFIIANESMEPIIIRPCYLQGDATGEIIVEARQRVPLHTAKGSSKKRENNPFDSLFRRHTKTTEETQIFVQFCKKEFGCASHSWSGPICIASLGLFFLKFRGNSLIPNSSNMACQENNSTEFAAARIVEEKSSFVLYFYMPPDVPLPYRIENLLNGLSVKYYQKNSIETNTLHSGASSGFVWDDLSLPHKLTVELIDFHLVREINIDKVSEWKPFFKIWQQKGLLLHFPLNKQSEIEKTTSDEPHKLEIFKVGFEIYADGSTRVLRFCEATKRIEHTTVQPSTNFQLRLSSFAIHLLERKVEAISESLNYVTIVVASLGNVTLDSIITQSHKYNHLRVQSFTVDEKWQGAPFASMVRRSHLHDSGMNVNILHIIYILQSTKSKVKQVKYSSIILQPIDLKIDEETLMKLAPFWRSSSTSSSKQSQQFYFRHFEIHPIKITASFLPGNQYPGYSSAQQALRSFLHSVLKVPSINNVILELNGVLLTHALVTSRELLVKCAQHYSWYLIRSVYIAKGSSLLPPAFASIFDDTASSSLDVFFDPSDGSISLPGVTLGMFKIISKCINVKGFSGTKRYFGDLGKMMKAAGSNVLFAAATEISDNVLRGAESSGFKGLVTGFHQGILRLAMDPSLLGAAVMEGGADRKIKLDRSPGIDELYIEGYLQAMLDVMYKLEYLRVRVIDNQVILKNLPPSSSIINEILENVKSFLVSKALLKGDSLSPSRPLRHLRSEYDWKLGPTVLTLVEHLFVSFSIRMLRKQTNKLILGIKWKVEEEKEEANGEGQASHGNQKKPSGKAWAVGKFFFSGMIAYVDGRLCRHIPHPLVRRIVSGFLLSFLDKNDGD
ncbi:hypothetical protein HPP92_018815 [Vanilla planifolia]|uniref:Vacuolar protein sorting-associated protein 13 VPS13 adaptor binding domain-containing protein n=1 Tax=Vanilla planifolia TaxID=51239 RepID=A0A835QAK5_VANPL|nr:hypothetical protein HPP92_018815 [Vanilla planifolia]